MYIFLSHIKIVIHSFKRNKLLLLFVFFSYSFIGFSQFPGCPNINAGVDQVLPCSQNCTNLTATAFQTGAPTSYDVSSITHSPPIAYNAAGGTAVSVDIDDVWSPPITLPFNFCYYGTNYTTINIGSNGAIQFGGGITGGTYHPWPFTASCPSAALTAAGDVFGVYHDIDPSVAGTVKWFITGTAPCRIFVVSYNNLGHFSCTSLRSTHMMVLYETTNVIDVYVNNKATCTSWNGGAAIIGIQNPAGTAGITAPGRNTNPIWTVTSPEAWRFTPNGTPNYTIAWFQGINQIGTSATINVCPVGTTTYTAQVTYTMCDGTTVQETDQVNVSYSSAVPVINLTSVNETCTGVSNGTATASPSGGAPGYTYSWSTIPIQTTQTATGLSAGTYTCAVTDANGCVATQNVTITANNPTISGILSVCVGVTSQLTGSDSPNVGTLWASSMGGVATVSSTGLVTGVTIGTTTITYTNSLGCTTTASVTITAAPSASISYADSPFCNTLTSAQSVTQTGTTGGTYSSTTGLSLDASTGAITPSTSTAGTYTVTYTIAEAGCAAVSTTTSVTITAAPSANISYAGSPFCNTLSSAQDVTQTGTTGGTYSSTTGLSINASTGAVTPSASTAGTYTVTYTLAASGGCSAGTTTATITIIAAPNASISYAGSPFCNTLTSAQSVTQTGTTGGTYSSTTGLSLNASTGAVNPSSSTAGTYTVTYTLAAGCAAVSTTTTVTITAPPTATIIYANSPYCKTVTTAQSVIQTGVTGGAYTANPIGLSINASSGVITPSSSSVGPYTVSYTLAASGGCAAVTTTASVTILAAPTIDIDPIACGYVYQVTGTTAFNGGAWSSSDTLINFSDSFANNPQISTEYAGIYTVSFTDNACDVTLTANIEFLPNIYTQVLDTNICIGSSFELNPLILNTAIDTLHNEWTLQPGYIPTINWFWENGSTDIPRIISGAGSYIFSIYNACDTVNDTATIGIKPCDISAPNIIVLSSDVGNNFFSVNTTGIVDFNCVILNRWGNVIYEFTDAAGGWDGKTADGNLVEEGTYFYRIKATYEGGEDVIKHGFVVLKY
jgi:hypothetical protein